MNPRFIERPAGAPAQAPAARWLTSERGIVLASVVLYLVSLGLPAIAELYPGGGRIDTAGYLVLGMGMIGLLAGQIGWFANPLWLLGAILLWRRRWTGAATAAAGALLVGSASFFLQRTGMPSDSGDNIPTRLLIGFYVWWASLWVLAIGAVVRWFQTSRFAEG